MLHFLKFYLIRFVLSLVFILFSLNVMCFAHSLSSHYEAENSFVCLFVCSNIYIIFFFFFGEFQLKICRGISYAAVAAHADKNGRRKLAAMLIEHEPRSSKQVRFSSVSVNSLFLFFFFPSLILY